MASYEQWLDAFQHAYRAPGQVSGLACPNCGATELHLLFVYYGNPELGANAVFWCGHCLEGMPPGPSEVPAACVPVQREDAHVPNYRTAIPSG